MLSNMFPDRLVTPQTVVHRKTIKVKIKTKITASTIRLAANTAPKIARTRLITTGISSGLANNAMITIDGNSHNFCGIELS